MPPQPGPPTHANALTLLSGPLEELVKYSRAEQSNWLIDIAHDICGPAAMRGSLFVWKLDAMQWSSVAPTGPLAASVYTYRLPAGVVVGLSKICGRTHRSVTGNANTMASRFKRRDGVCWATGVRSPIINSYICPKRMGGHWARVIYRTFSPTSPPIPNMSIYDERFGLTFSVAIDAYFNVYKLGLRAVGVNQYQCHVCTTAGETTVPTTNTGLHGLSASPPQPHHANNPPPGLLRWHYLQCVLDKFGHADYKALPNIRYSELPFRAHGDSDEGTDSEGVAIGDLGSRARIEGYFGRGCTTS
ncbi:hypothetical protein DFH07DRAFT_753812 [Mycena maculata]|uniref:Uncharacterized protein n=1 Tax=Mycena maculata TaxID=230809 RepID=A0AAD7I740_9AGAR|nr:hypothetical protein DFH07DRAFT_753812 [Mycena maculata]